MTDFKDPEDVNRAVVEFVKDHDSCSSEDVVAGISPTGVLDHRKAIGLALVALIGTELTGNRVTDYRTTYDHDADWDIRWTDLVPIGSNAGGGPSRRT